MGVSYEWKPGEYTWRPVYGYVGELSISYTGKVITRGRWVRKGTGQYYVRSKELTTRPGQRGPHLVISYDGTTHQVHRLVLQSFVGPNPIDKPFGCHRDDNPLNNHINNLYWGSKSDNERDKVLNGRNKLAAKELCVRGHKLEGNNLVKSSIAKNYRNCRSCGNARAKLNYTYKDSDLSYTWEEIQAVSDRYYEKFMELV